MVMMRTVITRQGTVILWPVRLPDADGGSTNGTNRQRTPPKYAITRWVRIKANMAIRALRPNFRRQSTIPEPTWPDLSFQELLRIAFRDRLVDRLDHPVIKRLRGMPDVLKSLPYRYIVAADFEFEFGGHASFEDASRSGERPRPVCVIAKELRSGQTWRIMARASFGSTPPFPIGPDALVRGVLRQRRTRVLSRSGLADAGQYSRPVRRIP